MAILLAEKASRNVGYLCPMNGAPATEFPPLFHARYPVERLGPRQIDEMLANGWFRNGLEVYISSVRFMGAAGWNSSLMLRVPLGDFSWKKRLAKLLRRNGERFRFEIRPFSQTPDKEALWQNFKRKIHRWQFIPPLHAHLLRGQPAENFNTWELCVYLEKRLVAFSVFDQGIQSIASLEAAYDPAFSKYSLGIYTMLLEIDFGIREGFSFYYSGFLPRGDAMFEYKLRPGGVEFFRLGEQKWLPAEQIQPDDWLLEVVAGRIDQLRLALEPAKIQVGLGFGQFEHLPNGSPAVGDFNLLGVVPGMKNHGQVHFFVAWDPVALDYKMFEASTTPPPSFKDKQRYHFSAIRQTAYLGSAKSPVEMAAMLKNHFE